MDMLKDSESLDTAALLADSMVELACLTLQAVVKVAVLIGRSWDVQEELLAKGEDNQKKYFYHLRVMKLQRDLGASICDGHNASSFLILRWTIILT